LPARLPVGNRRYRRQLKKPVSTVIAVLYREFVSVMFGRDRTAVLTIYPVGPGAGSDVGRYDQNGSQKTRRVNALAAARSRRLFVSNVSQNQSPNETRNVVRPCGGVER
jgi:hypothetical protein